ncbi:MAG: hypothetical protein A2Y33_16410 [Spirochaetes bacterium GWF1_51_8]|nr:MAG: hypothetical protein A2Y33_16410 [Spirochaetes bacterium GWF1_51_8]
MLKSRLILFLAIFTGAFLMLTRPAAAQEKKYYPIIQLCKDYQLKLKINLDLGYCDIRNDKTVIRLFLYMPYLIHDENIFYFEEPAVLDEDGGILLPKEYMATLTAILKKYPVPQKKPGGKELPVFIEHEQFVGPDTVPPAQKKTNQQTVDPGLIEKIVVIDESKKTNQKPADPGQTKITNTKPETGDKNPPACYNDDGFIPFNAVIIDAGHGGNDPGALGASGSKEKDVVLSLTKKVYQYFKNDKQFNIFLTRKNDTFVTLEDRVKFSSKVAKDYHPVFISIHANASPNKSVSGIEVFYLSDAVSDHEVKEVELLENAKFSQADIEKTEVLFSIIADLIRDGIKLESEQMANFVYKTLVNTAKAPGRGVKAGNFYVLKYNPVPAILIEVGFMSHKDEGKKLMNKDYQDKLAQGIYYGVKKYINEYNKTKGFCQ